MKFQKITNTSEILVKNILYLKYIDYDDYGYCTSYRAYVKGNNEFLDLGIIKIGCMCLSDKVEAGTSQNGFASYSIDRILPICFSELSDDFFSLGQSVEFYQNINKYYDSENIDFYSKINDLAYNFNRFKMLYNKREPSLFNSLMRDLHYANVEQFHRITLGDAPLTQYSFGFNYKDSNISFNVDPQCLPPSNIQVLIGRNGVGKTWLLYNMICRILESMDLNVKSSTSTKYNLDTDFVLDGFRTKFAGVIGMSFSVFDDGLSSINAHYYSEDAQEKNRLEEDFLKKYKYIGLIVSNKDNKDIEVNKKTLNITIKTLEMLADEFVALLAKISSNRYKKNLYLKMCEYLETDIMFKDNGFIQILECYFNNQKNDEVLKFFKKLSSGHMIIALSLTALCDSIFERTIVFIDEPETHLHPPLLSTYIRALSFLLRKRNAVAIIATHSPIILQEVPKGCVKIVERTQNEMTFKSPQIETFASGTDQLTREIFGYELIKTGFYKLLEENLKNTFDETITEFNDEIGFLGQIMIQGLLKNRGDDDNEEN